MQAITQQRLLTQIIAKHDAARAKADELMTCNGGTRREAQEMSYWRGCQNALNEVACALKGDLDFHDDIPF